MIPPRARRDISRRRLLQGGGALAAAALLPKAAAQTAAPSMIPPLAAFLAGRSPRWERLRLELPALADNGQAVAMRLSMPGPFAPGPTVQAIHLFSEVNPVSDMAVFEFPLPPSRVEIENRVRLAGSQRVAAVTVMSDGTLYAAAADVIVTLAACLDGT
jgi:sulfur-oxidizing protein SoxY